MYTGPVFEGLILEAVRVQRHYLLCPRSDIPTNLPSSKFPAKGKILNCILCIWQLNKIRIKYGIYGRIRNTVVQKWSWSREKDGTNYRVVLALLTRRLSNFRAIRQFLAQISRFRDSARSYGNTYWILKQHTDVIIVPCHCYVNTWKFGGTTTEMKYILEKLCTEIIKLNYKQPQNKIKHNFCLVSAFFFNSK